MSRVLVPTMPTRSLSALGAKGLEERMAVAIPDIEDVPVLLDWQRTAEALAVYFNDKERSPYLDGIARRTEARIGMLLRPATRDHDRSKGAKSVMTDLDKHLRSDFRALADLVRRGLLRWDSMDGEWRCSRRALLLYELHREMGGLKSSSSVEWYTPARYVDAAREVMGGIDIDPASSALANKTVKAERYFDEATDGLIQEWAGRVWLNPPYGKGSGLFTTKLIEEHRAERVSQAILLLNAYGFDAEWFQPLWDHPICFTDHRIEFSSPQRGSGGPANANIFIYFGRAEKKFATIFGAFGHIVRSWP